MTLIVGLGNPGEKFTATRHNAGFMAVDFFAKKNGFPDFAVSKKYRSLISKKENIMLAKPQTFMNDSGKAVQKIVKDHKSQMQNIIIVHDDIDLAIGTLKIVKDRGSAGHKGIDSIIQHIGNENVIRFRIGIASNDQTAKQVVLKKFTQKEQEILGKVIERSAGALDYFIEHGLEKTMNEYNR